MNSIDFDRFNPDSIWEYEENSLLFTNWPSEKRVQPPTPRPDIWIFCIDHPKTGDTIAAFTELRKAVLQLKIYKQDGIKYVLRAEKITEESIQQEGRKQRERKRYEYCF
jgi:hypothetical protein